jgi:hypothetical protein
MRTNLQIFVHGIKLDNLCDVKQSSCDRLDTVRSLFGCLSSNIQTKSIVGKRLGRENKGEKHSDAVTSLEITEVKKKKRTHVNRNLEDVFEGPIKLRLKGRQSQEGILGVC